MLRNLITLMVMACMMIGTAYAQELTLRGPYGKVWLRQIDCGVKLTSNESINCTDARYTLSNSRTGNVERWFFKDSRRILDFTLSITHIGTKSVLLRLRVTNRGNAPLLLDRITALSGLRTGAEFGKALVNEQNSWAGNAPVPRLRIGATLQSYWTVTLEKPSLAAGYLTGLHNINRFDVSGESNGAHVTAWGECDGCVLPPGAWRESDDLFISAEENPLREMERFADLAAKANKVHLWPQNFVTWCSWYAGWIRQGMYSYKQGLEHGVEDNIPRVKELFGQRGPASMRIVDDSDDATYGDYDNATGAVPHGMDRLTKQMNQADIMPGFWFPAFMVSNRTKLFKDNPEWLAMNADGTPHIEEFYGNQCGVLDATTQGGAAYFEQMGHTLYTRGFRYFMTDFLLNSLNPARIHDNTRTKAEMHRAALNALRRGFGHDTYWLGCGALLGPSMGLTDGMRIAGDSFGDQPHAYVQSAYRWFYNRKLWFNDPDAVVCRGKSVSWNEAWMSWMSLAGLVMTYGDTFDDLPKEQVSIYKRMFPPMKIAGRPLDLWENSPYLLWGAKTGNTTDNCRLFGVFNFGQSNGVTVKLNIDEITARIDGYDKPKTSPARYLLWDFWSKQLILVKGPDLTIPLPDRGGRVFAVREDLGRPRLIGTSGHFSCGALEVSELKWLKGTLSGRVLGNGGDETTLYIYSPKGFTLNGGTLAGISTGVKLIEPEVIALDIPAARSHLPFTLTFTGKAETMKARPFFPGRAAIRSGDPERLSRLAQLKSAHPGTDQIACYLDCGVDNEDQSKDGPKLTVVRGTPFIWDGAESVAGSQAASVLYDKERVEFELTNLKPNRDYDVDIVLWDYDNNGRVHEIQIKDQATDQWKSQGAPSKLPAWKDLWQKPETRTFTLRSGSKSSDVFRFGVRNTGTTENAVVSEVIIWENKK